MGVPFSQRGRSAIPAEEWLLIRNAIQRGQLTGSQPFIDEIAEKLGKRIEPRAQGRPKQVGVIEK